MAKAVITSMSFLGRVGNWSPAFIIPYQRFLTAMDEFEQGLPDERFKHFTDLLEGLREDQKVRFRVLVESLGKAPDRVDFIQVAEEARKIVLRHTAFTALDEKEWGRFCRFIRDWSVQSWKMRGDQLAEEAQDVLRRAGRLAEVAQKFEASPI